MFNKLYFENSVTNGIPLLEVVGGLEERREQSPSKVPLVVPLTRTALHGEIMGPLAALQLTQHFLYSSEVSNKVLEALYRFPLPGDAAVSNVRVRFGEVEIVAELKEREQAKAEYEAAKQEGKQAALTTRESPDVFTLHLAGLQPDEEITVETSYVQLAKPQGQDWTLRIPLTTAPRFVRDDELNSRHAQGQPFALLRDPGHRFMMDVTLHQVEEISSPTHKLDLTRKANHLTVTLQEGEVLPDRDCVLRWRAAQEERRPSLHVILHEDEKNDQLYFLALVAPPATHDYGQGVPREVILLVDHSGSMSGAKWEAADWTVERFLSDLSEQDAFGLGLFHTRTKWWKKTLKHAKERAIDEAVDYLKRSRDSGGTNLGVALEQALNLERIENIPARHLLIVTDAQVTDAGRVLRLADEEAQRDETRRISVICIDAAPNDFLASELAARGGGVCRFLTSKPDQGDITTALDEVLADWAEPVLAGLTLEINRSHVEANDRQTRSGQNGSSFIDLGDLPAGRAVWVSGRVPHGDGPLSLRLTAHNGHEVANAELDAHHEDDHRAIKALFGARRVLGLEFLINSGYKSKELDQQLRRLGYDPDVVMKGKGKASVYAENVRKDAQEMLRGLLVSEALDYGLACAETAFVAVRKEAGKQIEETTVVANALPAGWSADFLMAGGQAMRSMSMSTKRATRGGQMRRRMPSRPAPAVHSSPDMDTFSIAAMPSQTMKMPESAEMLSPPSPPSAGAVEEERSFFRKIVNRVIDAFTGDDDDDDKNKASRAATAPVASPPTPPVAKRADAVPVQSRIEKTESRDNAKSNVFTLFSGVPEHTEAVDRQILLFDSTQNANNLPHGIPLRGIQINFPDGRPKRNQLDRDLTLLLFVGDLSQPRAKVRLADVIRMRGKRPLNVMRAFNETVRLVLADPNEALKNMPMRLDISLKV